MAVPVPPGAYPECEKLEQQLATQTLGGAKAAFGSRRDSLVAMRNAVNDHEARLAALEAAGPPSPFPH
jgi:hypothetical protein